MYMTTFNRPSLYVHCVWISIQCIFDYGDLNRIKVRLASSTFRLVSIVSVPQVLIQTISKLKRDNRTRDYDILILKLLIEFVAVFLNYIFCA